ncbi:ATP-binding cassette domain-containing protein [Candidatus Dojkabacteria bacterium]|nr:ATP-binding cassette domain-containing protein [Candidatus Dojkabacteria bacterium]
MLSIKDLHIDVDKRKILDGLSLEIKPGNVVIIFGPNGCGKTTLFKAIMGLIPDNIKSGDIKFNGKSILNLAPDKISEQGIGLMQQNPPKVDGVTLHTVAMETHKRENIIDKYNQIEEAAEHTSVEAFLDKDLNTNLSGGEIKRSELFHLYLRRNHYQLFLLDEPDSGVDIDNLAFVGKLISEMVKDKKKSALIITHTGELLKHIKATKAYVMINGRIQCEGSPKKILKLVETNGYKKCINCKKTYE